MPLFDENRTPKKPRRSFAETFGLKRASEALDHMGAVDELTAIPSRFDLVLGVFAGLNERDDIWFDSLDGTRIYDMKSDTVYVVDHSLPRNPLTGTWSYKEPPGSQFSTGGPIPPKVNSQPSPTRSPVQIIRHEIIRRELTEAFGEQIPTPQRKENSTMSETIVPAVTQAPATKKGILELLAELAPADKSPQEIERESRIKAWQLLVADLATQFVDLGGLQTDALEFAEQLAIDLKAISEDGTLAIERIADKNIELPGAPVLEEKPKRNRRTKAEIEAEKQAAAQPIVEELPTKAEPVTEDPNDGLPPEPTPVSAKRPAKAEKVEAPEVDADDEIDSSQIPSDDADPDAGF